MYELRIIKPDGTHVIAGEYSESQKQDFIKYVYPFLASGIVLVWQDKQERLVPYRVRAGIARRW